MADADPEPLTDEAAAAIVGVLHAHGVTFIVIGGFAIQLHRVEGLARTSDIDVTPERSRQNLERLAEALTELQARLRGKGQYLWGDQSVMQHDVRGTQRIGCVQCQQARVAGPRADQPHGSWFEGS